MRNANRRHLNTPLLAGKVAFGVALGLVLGIVPVSALQTFPDQEHGAVQEREEDAASENAALVPGREDVDADDADAPAPTEADEGADSGADAGFTPGPASGSDPAVGDADDESDASVAPEADADAPDDADADTPAAASFAAPQTQTMSGVVNIASSPRVGDVLTANITGLPQGVTPSYKYQWYTGSTPVADATASQLHIGKGEHGKAFHVVVRASAAGYADTEFVSNTTAAVKYEPPTGKLSITGSRFRIGKQLAVKVGGLSLGAKVKKIAWYATGNAASVRAGAPVKRDGSAVEGSKYTPGASDKASETGVVGKYLYAVATLDNGDGDTKQITSAVTRFAIASPAVATDVRDAAYAHADALSSGYTFTAPPASPRGSAAGAAASGALSAENHVSVVLDDGPIDGDADAGQGDAFTVPDSYPWWWVVTAIVIVALTVVVCMLAITRAYLKTHRAR